MGSSHDAWRRFCNREIDPRASSLESLGIEGDTVTLRLAPAYVLASGVEPVKDGGSGWSVDVELIFSGATVRARPAALPCWISEAFVGLSGCARMQLISLPSSIDGDLTAYFLFANAEELLVKARRMEVIQRGEPLLVEEIGPEFWR